MNIEKLCRDALNFIKSKWEIPKNGIIAGGSLSNLIWESISGNKAIINDIDVFIFESKLDSNDSYENIYFSDKKVLYNETYTGLGYSTSPNDYYRIIKCDQNGIFNTIYYQGSSDDPSLILKSFDINCTQVGYDIKNDKFYYSKNFIEFLKTGELKITSLNSPSHTAIRLAKKEHELNAKLDNFEYDLILYTLKNRFIDTNRTRFSTKYFNTFKKYSDRIPFIIVKDDQTSLYLKDSKGIDIEIFYLSPKIQNIAKRKEINNPCVQLTWNPEIFPSEYDIKFDFQSLYLDKVLKSSDFLFYIRNIYKNDTLKKIWEKTHYFYNNHDYLDIDIKSINELELLRLSKIMEHSPNSINQLMGLKLSEQLSLINKLFSKYQDHLVTISILEKIKITNDIDLDDDFTLLLLELSVRREILVDRKNKVEKIIG